MALSLKFLSLLLAFVSVPHAHAESHVPVPAQHPLAPATIDLACSTITEVVPDLISPQSKMPDHIGGWVDRLGTFGETNAILIPFSRAPGSTGLASPRVLMTINGSVQNQNLTQEADYAGKRDLRGQLFLGLVRNPDGSQNLEFISWNRKTRSFDFGIVENYNRPEKRRLIAGEAKKRECLSCHKTGGPIFSQFPWSGTMADPLMGAAMVKALHRADPLAYKRVHEAIFGDKEKLEGNTREYDLARRANGATYFVDGKDTKVRLFDGPSILRTGIFDSNVRAAHDSLLLPNQVLLSLPVESRERLNRAALHRQFAALFDERVPLVKSNKGYLSVLLDAGAAEEKRAKEGIAGLANGPAIAATGSTLLKDYDQVKDSSAFRLEASDENLSHVTQILAYDERRKGHGAILPPGMRASNANAFGNRTENTAPPLASAREAALKKLNIPFRLSASDTELIDRILGDATGAPKIDAFRPPTGEEIPRLSKALHRHMELLRETLDSPRLRPLLQGGPPNRELFLKPFLQELLATIRRAKLPVKISAKDLDELPEPNPCDEGPKLTAPPALAKDAARHTCANCHVGEDKSGIVRFDFDPEDREAWKTALADPKRREKTLQRLARVIRRLSDGDMPPEDSDEYAYRQRSPVKSQELSALLKYLEGLQPK